MKGLKLVAALCLLSSIVNAQSKTIVGIMPFTSSSGNSGYYSNSPSKMNTQIQDAVSESFLNAKQFILVEREKMGQIKTEKRTQQSEDFLDGQVAEQSKSLGASYIVTGNVNDAATEAKQSSLGTLAGVPFSSLSTKIEFSLKVIDVSTGQIIASDKFSGTGKGKNGVEEAFLIIKPNLEKFIKDNFKVTVSVASIEQKDASGDASKILISGGSAMGFQPGTKLRVFEQTFLMVDGKKLARKKELGRIEIEKIDDENFSVCKVISGGKDIGSKFGGDSVLKCEVIVE